MSCKGKRHGKAGQSRLLGILHIAPVVHLTKIRYAYVKIIYYTLFLDSMYNLENGEIKAETRSYAGSPPHTNNRSIKSSRLYCNKFLF